MSPEGLGTTRQRRLAAELRPIRVTAVAVPLTPVPRGVLSGP
jgi:hypothetical protein